LLIASETALFTFNLRNRSRVHIVDLDADNPLTRSNDGRVDPQRWQFLCRCPPRWMV
jgi:sugar lactone lactonase YvrE